MQIARNMPDTPTQVLGLPAILKALRLSWYPRDDDGIMPCHIDDFGRQEKDGSRKVPRMRTSSF